MHLEASALASRRRHRRLGAAAASLAIVGALATPPAARAATLTRGPYLQLMTTTSVTIVWNTDVAATCGLSVRRPGNTPTVLADGTGTVCAVEASSLTPGTEYGYVPLADGTPLTDETFFRTDDPTRPFTLVVLGDSGGAGPPQYRLRDRILAGPVDVMLHVGDMIYPGGEPEHFDPEFFTPYRDLLRRLVFWPCLGNHDVRTANGQAWRDAFYTPANNPAGNEGYYSFDVGNAHVAVVDSDMSTSPGSAQYAFLDDDLAASTATWNFVAFHHTIYSSGAHTSNLPIQGNLVPLFDAHAVDLVFMGHDHDYERTKPLFANQVVPEGSGTIYVTTGGGGHSITRVGQSSFTAHAESTFEFTRVHVDGDALLLQMIRDDGSIGDALSLVKGAAPPPPICGDDLVNRPEEECDGADHTACAGGCAPDCTCAPICGDGVVNQPTEACDRTDDAACPDRCLTTACRCGPPSQFVILAPIADTYVESGTEATWDHGISDHLDSDSKPVDFDYLKFDLTGVPLPVAAAQLMLSCTQRSVDGGTVYPVPSSTWIEGDRTGIDKTSVGGPGLKWIDVDTNGDRHLDSLDTSPYVPDLTRWGGSFGAVAAGETYDVDVTALLPAAPGVVSLAITNESSDGATFASREHATAARRPRLRLELAAPLPTATATAAPPATAAPTPTPGGVAAPTATPTPAPTGTPIPQATALSALDRAPAADTYIEAGRQSGWDHGIADHLDVDLSPVDLVYLRFDLRDVTAPIVRATLELSCTNAAADGGTLYPVADSGWIEGTKTGADSTSAVGPGLTWDDVDTDGDGAITAADVSPWVPDFAHPLAVLGRVAIGQRVAIDVTAALGGPGVYTLALRSANTNGASYVAREGTTAAERPLLRLELAGAAPSPSATPAPKPTATPAATLDLGAAADTYVEAGTQSTWDHGAADHFDVDLSPAGIAYLKFDLSAVTAPVTRATLTLFCTNATSDGGTVFPVADTSWVEGTRSGASASSASGPGLTWADVDTDGDGAVTAADTSPYVPDFGTPIAVVGPVTIGHAVSVDVTAALQHGARVYGLAVRSGSANGATYSSREDATAGQRPRLHLTLAGTP